MTRTSTTAYEVHVNGPTTTISTLTAEAAATIVQTISSTTTAAAGSWTLYVYEGSTLLDSVMVTTTSGETAASVLAQFITGLDASGLSSKMVGNDLRIERASATAFTVRLEETRTLIEAAVAATVTQLTLTGNPNSGDRWTLTVDAASTGVVTIASETLEGLEDVFITKVGALANYLAYEITGSTKGIYLIQTAGSSSTAAVGVQFPLNHRVGGLITGEIQPNWSYELILAAATPGFAVYQGDVWTVDSDAGTFFFKALADAPTLGTTGTGLLVSLAGAASATTLTVAVNTGATGLTITNGGDRIAFAKTKQLRQWVGSDGERATTAIPDLERIYYTSATITLSGAVVEGQAWALVLDGKEYSFSLPIPTPS